MLCVVVGRSACYLNSYLQCLHLTDLFSSNVFHFQLKKVGQKGHEELNPKMLDAVKMLIAQFLITKR